MTTARSSATCQLIKWRGMKKILHFYQKWFNSTLNYMRLYLIHCYCCIYLYLTRSSWYMVWIASFSWVSASSSRNKSLPVINFEEHRAPSGCHHVPYISSDGHCSWHAYVKLSLTLFDWPTHNKLTNTNQLIYRNTNLLTIMLIYSVSLCMFCLSVISASTCRKNS